MPREYRYWRTTGNLHLNPPGIRVADRDNAPHYVLNPMTARMDPGPFPEDFSRAVRDALNFIYGTAMGRALLNHLTRTAHRPTISPANFGNSIQLIGWNHAKPAAVELHQLQPGPATRTAIRHMVGQMRFLLGSDSIARNVRSTPLWSLDARPGHTDLAQLSWSQLVLQRKVTSYAQSLRDRLYRKAFQWDSNEGYSEDQHYVSTKHGSTRGIYVTRDEIQNWLVGYTGLPRRLSQEEQRHVANVTMATIYKHAATGTGSAGSIDWRHQASYDLNALRPPAIGLAHELIHAYYASQGRNPGSHDSPPSVVLFEYICVGLGPFSTYNINENKLRSQWPTTHGNIPLVDVQNRKNPPQRVSYL